MDHVRPMSLSSSLVQAEYWQDPYKEEEYREKCVFLPDINQENVSRRGYQREELASSPDLYPSWCLHKFMGIYMGGLILGVIH